MIDSFSWQGLNDFIKQDPDRPGRIFVHSNSRVEDGLYTVAVLNIVTIIDEQGASRIFSPDGQEDIVEVKVEIINPCKTTELSKVQIIDVDGVEPFTTTVINGETKSMNF